MAWANSATCRGEWWASEGNAHFWGSVDHDSKSRDSGMSPGGMGADVTSRSRSSVPGAGAVSKRQLWNQVGSGRFPSTPDTRWCLAVPCHRRYLSSASHPDRQRDPAAAWRRRARTALPHLALLTKREGRSTTESKRQGSRWTGLSLSLIYSWFHAQTARRKRERERARCSYGPRTPA